MAEFDKTPQKDEENAFRRVYDLTWNDLSAYVIAHIRNADSAKDVLQTVYLSFWKRTQKHGVLPDAECLPYLKAAAKHEIGRHYGYIADYSYAELPDESTADGISLSDGSPEDNFCTRETCHEIFDELRQGDPLTYKIFVMRYSLCFPPDKIAEQLGISRAAVVNRISRMSARLRKKYR